MHLGSGDFPARVRVIGPSRAIEPGSEGAVRLWLRGGVPVPLLPGDRYVLREMGMARTVGGGEVLDVAPVLPASRASPTLSVQRVVDERGWVDAAELERLTGERRPPTVARWVLADGVHASLREDIRRACKEAGSAGVAVAGLPELKRAVLVAGVEGVSLVAGRAFEESAVPVKLSDVAAGALATLESRPWSPPDLPLSDRGALRELERRGLACQAGEVWFAVSAVDAAVAMLGGLLGANPGGFTVSEAREALGSTRKYVLPLLGYLDATGVTRRVGDLRVAGPRMPQHR